MEEKKFSVTKNRRRILDLLFKFRFVSIPLLQEYLGLKHPSTIWRTLQSLEKNHYIETTYEKSYVKLSKPAYYFLAKKSLSYLKDNTDLDRSVLHSYYKNKAITEETKQHYLDVFAAYNALRATYGDSYNMFTKSELAGYEDYPESLPDIYLSGSNGQEYFVTLVHDMQPFLAKKRLTEYVDHSEEAGWEDGVYPTLLFVVRSNSHEFQLLEHATKLLDSTGIDPEELPIAVTTIKALTQKPYTASIWTFVDHKSPVALE